MSRRHTQPAVRDQIATFEPAGAQTLIERRGGRWKVPLAEAAA